MDLKNKDKATAVRAQDANSEVIFGPIGDTATAWLGPATPARMPMRRARGTRTPSRFRDVGSSAGSQAEAITVAQALDGDGLKIQPQDDKWRIREVQRGLTQTMAGGQGNGENNRAQARVGSQQRPNE
ncbi:hypothetical protein N7519_003917 [Penicillium mononematosum]|uniref:uncharacterized protein n=1 Tax=Penicillium mononematosum TaxID=268346 RepID=UPI00254985CB|nr:uncharacterized protein N7519_003917 [Penicillium mononematosum]KAJ6189009.1 hypothetical protein N7519_003917 [Penicillium mononematosum]